MSAVIAVEQPDEEEFEPALYDAGAVPPAFAAVVQRGRPASPGIQAELALVALMRERSGWKLDAPESVPAATSLKVVWRLMLATAMGSAMLAAGAVLSALALYGLPVRINPYVALSTLLVGCALSATVVQVIRGDARHDEGT